MWILDLYAVWAMYVGGAAFACHLVTRKKRKADERIKFIYECGKIPIDQWPDMWDAWLFYEVLEEANLSNDQKITPEQVKKYLRRNANNISLYDLVRFHSLHDDIYAICHHPPI